MTISRVDIQGLNLCRPMTGVGRYIQDLSKLKGVDFVVSVPNEEIKIESSFRHFLYSNYHSLLGKVYWSFKPNWSRGGVVHYPQPLTPLWDRRHIIVTIHDTLFDVIPEDYSLFERLFQRLLLRRAIKMADMIVCVSDYTLLSLKQLYSVNKPMVRVYNPVDFHKVYERSPKNFFLLLSNRAKRKNIPNTIAAFKESQFYSNGFKLVICGTNDGALDLGLDDAVVDLGYVSESKLEQLYSEAYALLFFSKGEGFGYPILEAAVRGVPVLASNNTSITEIFGYEEQLLCSDYNSKEGIRNFLDKVHKDSSILDNILIQLNNFISSNSRLQFQHEMLKIYNRLGD